MRFGRGRWRFKRVEESDQKAPGQKDGGVVHEFTSSNLSSIETRLVKGRGGRNYRRTRIRLPTHVVLIDHLHPVAKDHRKWRFHLMFIRNALYHLRPGLRETRSDISDYLVPLKKLSLAFPKWPLLIRTLSGIGSQFRHQYERNPLTLKAIAFAFIVTGCVPAHSAGEHEYLEEGNSLVLRLTEKLISARVCSSIANCSKKEGEISFVKPERDGIVVSVFGVKRADVASILLQECVDSFATRNLGHRLTVVIFETSKDTSLRQPTFTKISPTFLLKMEK